ncbi:MAG TPA: hypothetical protein VEW48_22730 [Thermoanaerobaculia bacterium]|nr:hypothetical protein [Thermoanaerobaculia bacterium]
MSHDLEEPEPGRNQTAAAEPEAEVFTAAQAVNLLGLTSAKLARYIRELRLEVPRGNRLRITRADLEMLRTYHRNRADGPRFRESEMAREYAEALKEQAQLFRSLRKLANDALKVEKRLRKAAPAGLGAIHTLPEPDLVLVTPLSVSIAPSGKRYRASFPEADLEAMGATRDEALQELRKEIARAYERLEKGHFFYDEDRERLRVLKRLITRRP